MLPIVLHAEKGFTLLEFLAAVVILTVGLLGLLGAVNLGIQANMGNKLRKDAIMLADQVLENDRVQPFSSLASSQTSQLVNAGLGFVNYSVVKTVTPLSATSRSVSEDVTISWREHGQKKMHSLSTVISNEN